MGPDAHPAPRRPFALMEENSTFADGDNWVQAHTIYDADRGLVRSNRSDGARLGFYGDYWITKGIRFAGNRFKRCEHGVQPKLSPTPIEIAGEFSAEDYAIEGDNVIESSSAQVSLDTCGPSTSTRFIRNVQVADGLSVESFGAEWSRISSCRRAA